MRSTLLALVCALVLGAPAAHAQTVLDNGHADFAARLVDDALRTQIKDGRGPDGPVWRDVGDVLVRLGATARAAVPAGAQWSFLGSPGATVWVAPQLQKPGVPWLGWNTEAIGAADVTGAIAWRLIAVEGPGRVAVFRTDALGRPDRVFDSGDGLPDVLEVAPGTHAHGGWAFTRPGPYALTLEYRAQRRDGSVQAEAQMLHVLVDDAVPGPPGAGPRDPTEPGDDAPGPDRGGGPGPGSGDPQSRGPQVALLRAHARGRVVTARLRLSTRSRLRVAVLRKGKPVARMRPRTLDAGTRTVRFRLGRRLGGSRYMLRARAVADGRATVRERRLRIRGRR